MFEHISHERNCIFTVTHAIAWLHILDGIQLIVKEYQGWME